MRQSDDSETFLMTFERVVSVQKWPEDQWAILLAPLLTGEANVYQEVKSAIMYILGLTPEVYRQWIQPAEKTADQVIQTVVLEQFLLALPVEARQWVQRQQTIALPVAVQLVENYLSAEEELGPGREPASTLQRQLSPPSAAQSPRLQGNSRMLKGQGSMRPVSWGGHFGKGKTLECILVRFFWPGVYRDVNTYFTACPDCQPPAKENQNH
ncbi:hypothetical protein XELAEV_18022781mg [Xenopus laevis]|uniref:SCAN box domain-containing protein n=1 Tax=Xenopus laevis TaxID=8355 RepID=A0A974D3Q4_XENLA|nr:hypothetical protein XELAEV_18022781mg [Xenopus laevis]